MTARLISCCVLTILPIWVTASDKDKTHEVYRNYRLEQAVQNGELSMDEAQTLRKQNKTAGAEKEVPSVAMRECEDKTHACSHGMSVNVVKQ